MKMKRISHFEFQRTNPRRRPAWRWERAIELLTHDRYFSPRQDDAATGHLLRFLRRWRRCQSPRQLQSLAGRYPNLCLAVLLYCEASPLCLELEARVLARQSDVAIGLQLALSPATVQAYRDLFFQVEDRLDATSWIQHQIIGLDPRRPTSPEQWLLWVSYHYGPAMLDDFLAWLRSPRDEQRDLSSEAGRRLARIDWWLLCKTLPSNPETDCSLLRRGHLLLEKRPDRSKMSTVAGHFSHAASELIRKGVFPRAELPPLAWWPEHACPQPVVEGPVLPLKLPEFPAIWSVVHSRSCP